MSKRFISFFVICAFVIFASGCGGRVNVLDVHTNYPTISSSDNLHDVARAIINASAFKGWNPHIGNAGDIIATRHHAGYIAKVDITYTTDSFNIRYIDSDNMGYNGGKISHVYERWVLELRNEIKRRLSRL